MCVGLLRHHLYTSDVKVCKHVQSLFPLNVMNVFIKWSLKHTTVSLSLSHTHIHTLTLSLSHTHTHAHTHTVDS